MKKALSRYTLFAFLLPVFFVLHGFTENYDLVPLLPALRLLGIYLLVSTGLVLLFRLLYRNTRKAALVSFLIMAYYFFFGAFQDLLDDIASGTFLTRYVFILPLSLIVFILLLIFLKRSNHAFGRTTLYLNSLLLLLVILDTGWLLSKIVGRDMNGVVASETLIPCPDCPKPDIYLIVADGYPGRQQCKDILHLDNSPFEEELKERGFHVTDSSLANYNFTFFSMGSALNMNYLRNISGSVRDKRNIPSASKALKNNQLLGFFEKQGYQFHNFSIFDLKNKDAITRPTFWINDTRPITRQTFLSRLNRDLGYHLVTTFKIKPLNPIPVEQDLQNNELLYEKTLAITRSRAIPRFVYTHLMMPHHPYYFDSSGHKTPLNELTQLHAFNTDAAGSYILYSNKRLLALIDSILVNSPAPPLVILMSDHGFREIKGDTHKKTMFLNLNAVFFPNKDYGGFYKGMSNVNLFRVLLNSQFRQQLPLLKDSTIFLKD